jgi:hypothetical protein
MSERRFPRHVKVAYAVVGAVAVTAGIVALPDKPLPSASGACSLGTGFGRMFPKLPAATWSLDDLATLADEMDQPMQAEPDASKGFKFEMTGVPAGYTYVGQFIDHDITLDQRPNDLLSAVDITTLANGRTPQLDLDSVYGAGPTGSSHLYDTDHVHLRLGAALSGAVGDPGAHDLPRDPTSGQALIGDAREDENRMVASLHSIVTRFHNTITDDLRTAHPTWPSAKLFAEARRTVTWYYQWAVLTDFLPRMVGFNTLESVVIREGRDWHTTLRFLDPCRSSIPVEFTGAAYRFGHSMVRDDYQLNDKVKNLPVFDGSTDPRASVGGFQPSPPDYAVDWSYFFPMGSNTPQEAYKLDASLVPALRKLPGPAAGTASTILATRNLLRGRQLALPSGQEVARAMGLDPLPDDRILIGAALGVGADTTEAITDLSPAFAGNAPLWTYILAEAANESYVVEHGRITGVRDEKFRLGPVGGKIVAETIVGLLVADATSVIHHPEFRPVQPYVNRFSFADLIAKGTGIVTKPL